MTKKILCLDFDGVLHSYISGWGGGPEIVKDEPVPGAIQFLTEVVQYFQVCIFSSRSSSEEGILAMKSWLTQNHLSADILTQIQFPKNKPPAFVTIDDRALTFTGAWLGMEELKRFKPWNQTEHYEDVSILFPYDTRPPVGDAADAVIQYLGTKSVPVSSLTLMPYFLKVAVCRDKIQELLPQYPDYQTLEKLLEHLVAEGIRVWVEAEKRASVRLDEIEHDYALLKARNEDLVRVIKELRNKLPPHNGLTT